MPNTYKTHMLPQYVKKFFGGKITMTKKGPNAYHFEGPNFETYIHAYGAEDATIKLRNVVKTLGNITDKRTVDHRAPRRIKDKEIALARKDLDKLN